jgi:hypothetical protein
MPIELHTKTGKEKEVLDILKAWKSLYPAKYRFFKNALREMRKVQKHEDGSFVDAKGRVAQIRIRVPTELWLYLQHRIDDFGKDYSDIELLLKVAGDYFSQENKLAGKRQIWSSASYSALKKAEARKRGPERRDDSKERRVGDSRDYPESKSEPVPA